MAQITRWLFGPLLTILLTTSANDNSISFPKLFNDLALTSDSELLIPQSDRLIRLHKDGSTDELSSFLGLDPRLAVENSGTVLIRQGTTIKRFNIELGAMESIPDTFSSLTLQPDGKLLVIQRNSVVRLNADGSPDPSLTPAAFQRSPSSVITLQDDGGIVVGPISNGSFIRLNSNGTPDSSFITPAFTLALVDAVLIQADGKIIVGGRFLNAGGVARYGLARLNADGSLDSSFGEAFVPGTTVQSLALQANGKIIASGFFPATEGSPAANVVRLHPDGSFDKTFDAGWEAASYPSIPIALADDGTLFVGLSTKLARIEATEGATQALNVEGSTLTWLRGGAAPEIYHARFQVSTDGTVWTDLGSGQRLAGGWRIAGVSVPVGARVRARGYVSGRSYHLDYVPGAPALYAQPKDRTNNAGTGVTLLVSAKGLEPLEYRWLRNGELLAGAESATLVLTNLTGASAGGYSVIVSNSEGSSTSRVAQLTVIDPVILSQPSSAWVNAGDTVSLGASAAGANLTFQWKKDDENVAGATGSTLVISNSTPDITGRYELVVSSSYGVAASDTVSVRVNTALPETNWNPKYEATTVWFPIQTAIASNNVIYMGGLFRTIGGTERHHLLRFQADGSIDPLFAPEPGGGEEAGVAALSLATNGQLLVGGNFLTIAGQSQPYLARLNPDGTLDQQFRPVISGPVATVYTQVLAIEILLDGRILIGGFFSQVNGQPRPGLALLSADGQLDNSFDPDPVHAPSTTGLFVQPDGKIIAYGSGYRRFHFNGEPDFDFTEAITATDFLKILPLSDGELVVNSQANILQPQITLVDRNGEPNPDFAGAGGELSALQSDGKFLIKNLVELIPVTVETNGGTLTRFNARYALSRMDRMERIDPAFSPWFDGNALVKAALADGSFLVAGDFSSIAGYPLPRLGLIRNSEMAVQTLFLDGNNATWLRSDTSPEVTRVVFEFSNDDVNWTRLGEGNRIDGGWTIHGLNLGSPGKLRARGFSAGSIYDTTIGIGDDFRMSKPEYNPQDSAVVLTANSSGASHLVLQMSTDLQQWTSIQTNSPNNQSVQFNLTNQPTSCAFYRLLQTSP